MATVTIRIVSFGSRHIDSNGVVTRSRAGHMWYELDDGNGNIQSFGFAPVNQSSPIGPGDVVHTDVGYDPGYSRTFDITQSQYDAMNNFGKNPQAYGFSKTYNLLNNNCTDFTWRAMEFGGLNPWQKGGDLIPGDNIDDIMRIGRPWWLPDLPAAILDGLAPIFGTPSSYNLGGAWGGDPLVLDLNGDGQIELTSIDNGVRYDVWNDGYAERTGWVGANDGILVFDA